MHAEDKTTTISNGHVRAPLLVSAANIPPIMRIPFIVNGYRILHQPWSFYFKSIVTLHNETFNVWTHLVGGILVLVEAIRLVQDFGSKWPMESQIIQLFTACSVIMHFCSSLTHLLHSRSCAVHLVFFMCDYGGISLCALGISLCVFCFCSLPEYANVLMPYYLPLATVNSVLLTVVFGYVFATRRRQYSMFIRVIMFIPTLCFYGWTFATFLYQFYVRFGDPTSPLQLSHVSHMLVLGFSFTFYATRLPERKSPGVFDIFGSSHQFFHAFVSISQWLLIRAVRQDLENDSPLLYSRQAHPLSMAKVKACFSFVIFANLSLTMLYHQRYMKNDDTTQGTMSRKSS